MLKIRNPWGKREYTGKGRESDHSFWAKIPESADREKFYGKR